MPKRQRMLLQESASPTTLAEARPTLVAEAVGDSSGRMVVQLIDSGWGSSGYYSADVLAEAASSRVFAEGTQMFADHPRGDGSGLDGHGNRSVHDLWAVLTSDATVSESGALIAEAQIFAPYRELVADMASSIGLSIRATGQYELGEAEGRQGPIITSLDEALSVDFVVAAGRGGRILQVVESARAHATAIAEALPGDMTADGLRAALHDAVRASYGASSDRYAYVEDFTDTAVYFRAGGENIPTRLWSQAYSVPAGGNAPQLTGEPTEVRAETHYVPVDPAGLSTTTTESQGGTMPQIEEARLRQLEADAGRVSVLESELATTRTERDTAAIALAEARARTTASSRARARVTEANATLAPATVDRIVTTATATVPLTDTGQLDEAALDAAVDMARTAEETYLASLQEASGAGRVIGLGGGTTDSGVVSEAALDNIIAGAFGRTVKEA